MQVFRASRRPRAVFDPLDSSASVARNGWRFNDKHSEVLYAAGRQALALLEGAARPGWGTLDELTVAILEVRDGSLRDLADLGIRLPSNWNARPVAPHAQRIGAEFLAAVDREAAAGRRVCGLRVPSVISTTDFTVLLDPRQKSAYAVADWARIPFNGLLGTAT